MGGLRARAPLRLIDTKSLNRDQWLDVRKQGIGSSDAAAAIGLHPYMSQLELWLAKTNQDQALPKPDPDDTTSPTFWGTLLEPIVASAYTKQTGRRVRKVNAVLQHPERPFMLANIDREVIGDPDVQLLECKTAGIHGAKLWRDGPPEYVQVQVQHQLAVTGKQAADIAVLIGGQELRVYRVQRDDILIAHLIQLEASFWQHVESGTPPSSDGSASSARALQALYPESLGTTMDFSENPQLNAAFTDLVNVREVIAGLEKTEAQLKQTIQQAMGSATRAVFETGVVTWSSPKPSLTWDTDRLAKEHPALVEAYTKPRAASRRFTVTA